MGGWVVGWVAVWLCGYLGGLLVGGVVPGCFVVLVIEPRTLTHEMCLLPWSHFLNPVCLFWREVLGCVLFLFFNHTLPGNLKVTMSSSLAHI